MGQSRQLGQDFQPDDQGIQGVEVDSFEQWLASKKLSKPKNYRERVKAGIQTPWASRPKKKMRKASKKYAKQLKTYNSLKEEFLLVRDICECCKDARAEQVHHKAGRGKNLNKVETWMAVCQQCHRHIEDHKQWARAMKYILY